MGFLVKNGNTTAQIFLHFIVSDYIKIIRHIFS